MDLYGSVVEYPLTSDAGSDRDPDFSKRLLNSKGQILPNV
jgi:hypothetical protein